MPLVRCLLNGFGGCCCCFVAFVCCVAHAFEFAQERTTRLVGFEAMTEFDWNSGRASMGSSENRKNGKKFMTIGWILFPPAHLFSIHWTSVESTRSKILPAGLPIEKISQGTYALSVRANLVEKSYRHLLGHLSVLEFELRLIIAKGNISTRLCWSCRCCH